VRFSFIAFFKYKIERLSLLKFKFSVAIAQKSYDCRSETRNIHVLNPENSSLTFQISIIVANFDRNKLLKAFSEVMLGLRHCRWLLVGMGDAHESLPMKRKWSACISINFLEGVAVAHWCLWRRVWGHAMWNRLG